MAVSGHLRIQVALVGLLSPFWPSDLPQRASLVAETNAIEIHREDLEEELGMRIVGGKDTPLGNIVVQEVLPDSVVAVDGRIAPGDHILEVGLQCREGSGWKVYAMTCPLEHCRSTCRF